MVWEFIIAGISLIVAIVFVSTFLAARAYQRWVRKVLSLYVDPIAVIDAADRKESAPGVPGFLASVVNVWGFVTGCDLIMRGWGVGSSAWMRWGWEAIFEVTAPPDALSRLIIPLMVAIITHYAAVYAGAMWFGNRMVRDARASAEWFAMQKRMQQEEERDQCSHAEHEPGQ